jgi:hypothetical protein
VGHGDKNLSPRCTSGRAWEYHFLADSLFLLADPVGGKELDFEQAGTGSICPAFANHFSELTGREVVIVSAARGGSSCHHKAELNSYGTWDTVGSLKLFDNTVKKIKGALAKTNQPLSGIIWLQGERDANAINERKLTPVEYRQALESLILRFREVFGKKLFFYIVQTGYYTGFPTEGFDAVRKEQEAIGQKDPYTFLVYNETGLFPQRGWMTDEIHYNQPGLNDIGKKIAEKITDHKKEK